MNKQLVQDSVFKIGKVFSVEGRTVKIEVDKKKNSSHLLYNGELVRNVSVNSYVKITKGFTKIIGKVDGEYTKEDEVFSGKNYANKSIKIKRILIVSLLGFFSKKGFERGIKELPLIDNDCFLLDKDEYHKVHDFVSKKDKPLTLGSLTHENNLKIKIGINDLFASHIGIFGNTGSGKSYTLSKIYFELFKEFKDSAKFKTHSKFLMYDFNGEYNGQETITTSKKVFNLSVSEEQDKDKIPFNESDLLDLDLFCIMASATEKTQRPFLKRTLKLYNNIYSTADPLDYFRNILLKRIKSILQMADKENAYLLLDYFKEILPPIINDDGFETDLLDDLGFHNNSREFLFDGDYLQQSPERIEETLIYNQAQEYDFPENFISRLNHFLYLQLISDVLSNRAKNDHISPAINKLKSFQKEIEEVIEIRNDNDSNFWTDHNYCVINLNKTSVKIKKMIPLLLSTKLYKEHKEENKNRQLDDKSSLNIVVDEAHNILSYSSERESESWKDYRLETFEEIIKEGRKFGVFMTISSQRPSDISSTIISQLHNFFLHRLINNNDIAAIERTVSYLDKLSFESLPILPTGTCIFAGIAAQVPVLIDIGKIEEDREPDNKNYKIGNELAGISTVCNNM